MYAEEDELNSKRTKVAFEMQSLAHAIKRYFDGMSEDAGTPGPKGRRGMSGTNWIIIAYLYENRGRDIFQKDLEEKLNVRRSTISKVLQIMESKDMIRREQVEQDGRLKKIVLTQKAHDGIHHWKEHSRQMESKLTIGFNEEELDQFYLLLNKAKQNFRD